MTQNNNPPAARVTTRRGWEVHRQTATFQNADDIRGARLPEGTSLSFELMDGEWSWAKLRSTAPGTPNIEVNATSGTITVGRRRIDVGFNNDGSGSVCDTVVNAMHRAMRDGSLSANEALRLENLRQHIIQYAQNGSIDAREQGLIAREANNIAPGRN